MEFVEQLLHVLWAAAPLVAFRWIPVPVLNGAVAGIVLALPRELVDQWPIERPWDTVFDLTSFAVGGMIVALIAWSREDDRV